jgi:hypothetical protein
MVACCSGLAWILSCAPGFSAKETDSGGAAGEKAGAPSSGSGGSLAAGDAGSTASGAGTASSGGNAGLDSGGSSGEGSAGDPGLGGTTGGSAGSSAAGGQAPSGGMPGRAGRSGDGGQANAAGMGTAGTGMGGMGNPDPVSHDALVYWFSADVGVTETSGAVSKWLDRSGNESHAVQISEGNRPKLDRLAGSDLAAVVFDGEDDYLGMPPLLTGFDAGVTFFSVARATSGDACMAMLEVSNGSEIDDVSFLWDTEAMTYEVTESVVHGQIGAFAVGEPRLLEVTHGQDEEVSLFLNGIATGAATFALPISTTRNQAFLGRTLYLNCSTWSGEISEVLLYSRVLPADERVEVEAYLIDKWGCCSN